ncbi:hypothetical protein B1A99_27540 [Cohnella sp. CIP 111063]|uniref:hypothetical protein n=1 Tax=unclassified Cohnella TaxID=2636738 RepID=UPI000B8BC391|nr:MULTISPECIES: hypothetical protein [unclassified Cohnella]OXS53992.1 hypothetical protein B1A99_27540 [Cohnella sp. CIP 111063]PRX62864.1 hypothetical protein B0G52_12217 [Cohnella sp. SGD-V74]
MKQILKAFNDQIYIPEVIKLLGEHYFKQRYIDTYDYSLMKYKCGSGKLSVGMKDILVRWECVISITGELIFNISTDDTFGFYLQTLRDERGELSGRTDDNEWIITAKEIFFTRISSKSDKPSTTIACLVEYFNCKKEIRELNSKRVLAYISNFDFVGVEFTESERKFIKDKFTVKLHGREFVFQQLEHRKLILEIVKSKKIDRAIFSKINFSILNDETKEEVDRYLELVSWFLSLVGVKATMIPLVEYYNDRDELIEIEFRDLISSPFHSNIVIDNLQCRRGLVQYFNECYDNFVKLYTDHSLNVFVASIVGMYEGKFLEHKIAGLILSYEFLLTKYLVNLGNDLESIKRLSIQDKLRTLNKYMKFIPARLLTDTIRQDVRNALFHTGEIPALTDDEKYELYKDYYDLLIQIILRILGYRGNYITPKDYSSVSLYRE